MEKNRMRTRIPAYCIAALLPLFAAAAPPDQAPRPSYTAAGALNLPADYREWVFLSSGVDMRYSATAATAPTKATT